jgi:AbrB family looped-hinge helix DNA binding protein
MRGMRTTIDRAGRVVVPKSIRERLHLLGGGEVDVVERSGVIEIVPVPAEVRLVHTPEGPVAVATSAVPSLTDDEVLAARDASRR